MNKLRIEIITKGIDLNRKNTENTEKKRKSAACYTSHCMTIILSLEKPNTGENYMF